MTKATTDLLEEYCQKFRNWGKWGPDDQRGTANYITPAIVLEAMKLPRTGQVISMAMPYDTAGPQTGTFNRVNPIHQMLATGTDHAAGNQVYAGQPFPRGFGYSDDTVMMPLQCGTQWDGLSHIFRNGKMWNGYAATEVTAAGAARNGIEQLASSLVGRGVLLDIARFKKVEYLERGYGITVDDLNGAAAAEGVEVREGDIVIVRTGEMGRCQREHNWGPYPGGDSPGMSFYTAPWLAEKRIAAIATDTWGVEMRPNELPNSFQPLHLVMVVNMGLLVGEIWSLEALGDACAADGRYEFLFVGPPLPFTGAVGSPLNPLAIR